MDFRTFAEAYRPDPTANPWDGSGLVPSEMVEMHDLLNRFGQFLHARLRGTRLTLEAFNRASTLYVNRALALEPIVRQHHEATLASMLKAPDAADGPGERAFKDYFDTASTDKTGPPGRSLDASQLLTVEPQHYIRVLNGGIWAIQMFGHTQSQWYETLTGRPIGHDAWVRSRISLANNAATTIAHRDMLYEAGVLYLPEIEPLRQAITGNLAEADALITLLSVASQESGLTVIPAPPQFEAYAGTANADFLVLDLPREQIIGIQVKSFEAYKSRDRYDPDRVILIDGSLDLFGTLSRRTRLGHSDASTRSWPGQITSHFLSSVTAPRAPWFDKREFTTSRSRVQSLAKEARDRNQEAEAIVRERVFTALGR